jgi:dUTP pyrophosphatase
VADPIIPCTGSPDAIPRYQSEGASGADLRASLETDILLEPGQRALVPTGVRLQIPAGLEGQVRPRSGLAARNGVTVLNAPGTVDSDYRGEVKVVLVNLGQETVTIRRGDRIAQLVICPVVRASFAAGAIIDETERGSGGFGSTGK